MFIGAGALQPLQQMARLSQRPTVRGTRCKEDVIRQSQVSCVNEAWPQCASVDEGGVVRESAEGKGTSPQGLVNNESPASGKGRITTSYRAVTWRDSIAALKTKTWQEAYIHSSRSTMRV